MDSFRSMFSKQSTAAEDEDGFTHFRETAETGEDTSATTNTFVGENSVKTADEDDDDITNLLLVGKTGEGKSSTANTIIGKKKFHSSARSSSDTKECQREMVKVQGQPVLVVDSPGLADTDMSTHEGLKQLETEITNILTIQPDGFDAILIITKFGKRLTAEDCQIFDQLEKFFGEDYARDFGILLVSSADNYDPEEHNSLPIETFLFSDKGHFQDMLRKCNNRMICFDNRTKDESVRQAQVKRLLDMVAEMKQNSERFTPEVFKKAQQKRDEAILKSKEPIIRDKTEKSLRLITEDLEKLPRNMASIEQLKGLNAKLRERHEELIKQDKGTKVLEGLIASVKSLENRTDEVIKSIVTLHKMEEENKERTREEEKRRAKWEEEEKAKREEKERARREAEEKVRLETEKWMEIERKSREEMEKANEETKKLMTQLLEERERHYKERMEQMEKAEEERKELGKQLQDEREKRDAELRERFQKMEESKRVEREKVDRMFQEREKELQGGVERLQKELDNSVMYKIGIVWNSMVSTVSGWWPWR